jgi:hypothetical protein
MNFISWCGSSVAKRFPGLRDELQMMEFCWRGTQFELLFCQPLNIHCLLVWNEVLLMQSRPIICRARRLSWYLFIFMRRSTVHEILSLEYFTKQWVGLIDYS